MLPVGKEYFFACAIRSGRRETTVTCLFAEHGSDTRAIFGEDDECDAEAEVLEIQTSPKEVVLHAVLKKEIFDLLLDCFRAFAGIVLQALAVAYFGVPLLAGGKRFIGLNLLEYIIGHEVIRTPRDVLGVLVDLNRRNLPVLFEERGGVRDKYRPGLELWYIDHGVKCFHS